MGSERGRQRAFTSLTTDSSGSRLYAISADNHVYAVATSNFKIAERYSAPGYETGSYYQKVSISPDDQYLASGSKLGPTFIWSVRGKACYELPGHSEVTAVSWSGGVSGPLGLLSASEDGRIVLWSEPSGMERLAGYREPTFILSKQNVSESSTPIDTQIPRIEQGDHLPALDDLPLRRMVTVDDKENVAPEQAPTKKSIADFFKALPITNRPSLLSIASHRTASREATPSSKKRPSMLDFCTPSRAKAPKNSPLHHTHNNL